MSPSAVFWQKYISESLEIQIKIEKQNKHVLSQIFMKVSLFQVFFRHYGNIDQILLFGTIFSKNKVLDLEILSLMAFCFCRITEKLSFWSFCFHKTIVQWYLCLFTFCMQKDRKTITKIH